MLSHCGSWLSTKRPQSPLSERENLLKSIMKESCQRITLNVKGCRYQTFKETLDTFPDTLLGSEEKRSRFYDPQHDEYCFERDRSAFDAILFYYQSKGILSRPATITAHEFDEELRFYEIRTLRDDRLEPVKEEILPRREWQRKMWQLLERPQSSRRAAMFAKLSVLVITFSIFAFCVETLEMASARPAKFSSSSNKSNNATGETHQRMPRVWFAIDTCVIIWFSLEYLARVLSAPEKIKFILSTLALIDLVAITPYFLSLGLSHHCAAISFTSMRIFRLLRVVRLLKLTRYVAALRILGHTLRYCQEQLIALMFLLVISVVLFSSCIYFIESKDNPEQFHSIPASIWWTIVTMTTVGYGDMAPVTPLGRLMGALCAIFGVVVLVCLPSPVFISSFNDIYLRYIGALRKDHKKAPEKCGKCRKLRSTFNPSKKYFIRTFCRAQRITP